VLDPDCNTAVIAAAFAPRGNMSLSSLRGHDKKDRGMDGRKKVICMLERPLSEGADVKSPTVGVDVSVSHHDRRWLELDIDKGQWDRAEKPKNNVFFGALLSAARSMEVIWKGKKPDGCAHLTIGSGQSTVASFNTDHNSKLYVFIVIKHQFSKCHLFFSGWPTICVDVGGRCCYMFNCVPTGPDTHRCTDDDEEQPTEMQVMWEWQPNHSCWMQGNDEQADLISQILKDALQRGNQDLIRSIFEIMKSGNIWHQRGVINVSQTVQKSILQNALQPTHELGEHARACLACSPFAMSHISDDVRQEILKNAMHDLVWLMDHDDSIDPKEHHVFDEDSDWRKFEQHERIALSLFLRRKNPPNVGKDGWEHQQSSCTDEELDEYVQKRLKPSIALTERFCKKIWNQSDKPSVITVHVTGPFSLAIYCILAAVPRQGPKFILHDWPHAPAYPGYLLENPESLARVARSVFVCLCTYLEIPVKFTGSVVSDIHFVIHNGSPVLKIFKESLSRCARRVIWKMGCRAQLVFQDILPLEKIAEIAIIQELSENKDSGLLHLCQVISQFQTSSPASSYLTSDLLRQVLKQEYSVSPQDALTIVKVICPGNPSTTGEKSAKEVSIDNI
jgi:hypothetical protein